MYLSTNLAEGLCVDRSYAVAAVQNVHWGYREENDCALILRFSAHLHLYKHLTYLET